MLKMTGFARKKILPLVMTLANSIINKLGFVELINQSVSWDPTHWSVTPGDLAKAVVLSTFFDIRTPLTHLADRFEGIDMEYFISPKSKSSDVNSFNAGRALERIGNSDYGKMYETLALSAIRQSNIPVQRLHSDTTTISFYGEYDVDMTEFTEEERENLLEIERGYNKDGRPKCKQAVFGEIVNEDGIPICSRVMNGSTSDNEWNAEAIKYLRDLQEEGFQYGIYVADSKLVYHKMVSTMNQEEGHVNFVSRCPANFEEKIAERMILRAYETGQWEDMGSFNEGKTATSYQSQGFSETVCGAEMRFVVLESSLLKDKVEKALKKELLEIKSEGKQLEKKVFRCEADVAEEIKRFNHSKRMSRYECVWEAAKQIVEKWPKGRRGPNTKPVKVEESWQIKIKEICPREVECENYRKIESCIVLISNAAEKYSDIQLVKTYKGQHVVENSFRSLKSPSIASVIYLKTPARIEALSMLVTFSLLIRAILQYRLRQGLKKFEEANPGKKLCVGWGDRPLKNPTYRLLFEHCINCYFEREGFREYSYAWPSVETRFRVTALLALLEVDLEELVA